MFPIYALVAVLVLGTISYWFKSEVDPDLGDTRRRRLAILQKVMSWGLVYVFVVSLWWFKEPLARVFAQDRFERLVEESRPK